MHLSNLMPVFIIYFTKWSRPPFYKIANKTNDPLDYITDFICLMNNLAN